MFLFSPLTATKYKYTLKSPLKKTSINIIMVKLLFQGAIVKKENISAKKFIVRGKDMLNIVNKNQIILAKNILFKNPRIIIVFRLIILS